MRTLCPAYTLHALSTRPKSHESEEIARLTAEFQARGGTVKQYAANENSTGGFARFVIGKNDAPAKKAA